MMTHEETLEKAKAQSKGMELGEALDLQQVQVLETL